MHARAVSAALAITAVLCAACGSGAPTSTSQRSTSQRSTAQGSTSALPLSAYLVRGQEETGLPPSSKATAYLTPTQWTANGVPNAAAENTRLAREGFRKATSVRTGSAQSQGVSWAMELGSASAAAREKGAELQEFASGLGAPAGPGSPSPASPAARAGPSRPRMPTSCSPRGDA